MMSDSCPNVFWKPEIKDFMLVYVDDFKIVAMKGDHNKLWDELKQVIDMGEEEEEHRFLGCHYSSFECKAGEVEDILKQHPSYHQRLHFTKEDCNDEVPIWTIDRDRIVKGKMYDMTDFVDQCVDTFCALGNIVKSSIKPAKTPFIDEPKGPKDWVVSVEKDSESEDKSEHRNRALDDLG